MSSPWTWALVGLAIIALTCSRSLPRAWRWIGFGGVAFFATTLFLDYGPWPKLHPLASFICDAVVCFAIYHTYMHDDGADWEIAVFIAFLCSCLASLFVMAKWIPTGWVYASVQEACNAGALLWITWTGLIEMFGRHENSPVHSMRASLLRTRSMPGTDG